VLTPEALAATLLQHYGLQVRSQRALPGELDQNVAAVLDDGGRVVVKVSRREPAGGSQQVTWQNEVLRHLERSRNVSRLPVPRLRTTVDGEDLVEIGSGTTSVSLRVLSWLPGTMLSELPRHPPALLHELGAVAARLTLALSDLPLPDGAPPTHHWDLLRAPQAVAANLPSVRERARREDVTM